MIRLSAQARFCHALFAVLLSIKCCDAQNSERQAAASYEQLKSVNDSLVVSAGVEVKGQPSISPGWWKAMVLKPLRSESSELKLSLEQTLVHT